MKSKKNTEFEILLQEITEKTGLSYTEISRKVGRNDGYIAQIKSRIKNNLDEVPDKFMELLKLHFANWNEAAEPQAAYFTKNIDAGKAIGGLIEKDIQITARLTVVEQMLEQVVSVQSGQSIAVVSGERKKAVNMEANRLFDEQKRKV